MNWNARSSNSPAAHSFRLRSWSSSAGMAYRLVRVIAAGLEARSCPAKGKQGLAASASFVPQGAAHLALYPWVKNTFNRNPVIYLAGGLFHLGLFVVLILGTAHMLVWKSLLGFGWPTLPLPIVDWLAAGAIVGHDRPLHQPAGQPRAEADHRPGRVAQLLFVFLPMVSGYILTHHLFFPYEMAYSLHMLSVDLAADLDPAQPHLALHVLLLLKRHPRRAVRQARGVAVGGGRA